VPGLYAECTSGPFVAVWLSMPTPSLINHKGTALHWQEDCCLSNPQMFVLWMGAALSGLCCCLLPPDAHQ
jgi:hypothetical protein